MDNLYEKIAEQRKKLVGILKNPQARQVLNKWLLTELTYTSNAIEGNTLTRRETALAIEQNITSASKPLNDYLEAKNHSRAFGLILKLSKTKIPIRENDILSIHKEILKGINNLDGGKYRNVRVRIAGSGVVFPNPVKVANMMKSFTKWINQTKLNAIEKAIEAHFKLVSIHPFIDGNGRTARLVMNLILFKNGYYPLIIRLRDRKRYIDSLETAQIKGNLTPYNLFMLKALKRSLQTYIDMLDKNKQDISSKNLLTISQFAYASRLPVSTIRYYLRIGKLRPIARTESDYMLFSRKQIKELK
jgi:Fic family protein